MARQTRSISAKVPHLAEQRHLVLRMRQHRLDQRRRSRRACIAASEAPPARRIAAVTSRAGVATWPTAAMHQQRRRRRGPAAASTAAPCASAASSCMPLAARPKLCALSSSAAALERVEHDRAAAPRRSSLPSCDPDAGARLRGSARPRPARPWPAPAARASALRAPAARQDRPRSRRRRSGRARGRARSRSTPPAHARAAMRAVERRSRPASATMTRVDQAEERPCRVRAGARRTRRLAWRGRAEELVGIGSGQESIRRPNLAPRSVNKDLPATGASHRGCASAGRVAAHRPAAVGLAAGGALLGDSSVPPIVTVWVKSRQSMLLTRT